jgi:hypothetical protein
MMRNVSIASRERRRLMAKATVIRTRGSLESLAHGLSSAQAAAVLVHTFIDEIGRIDAADKSRWRDVIAQSLAAGLTKKEMAEICSCNEMTVDRWRAGHHAPTPVARRAIKVELMTLLKVRAGSLTQGKLLPHLETAEPAAVAAAT